MPWYDSQKTASQVLYLILQAVAMLYNFLLHLKGILSDFQRRRFYNPFRRDVPLVIHEESQMKELCQAPELSQSSAYSEWLEFGVTSENIKHHAPSLDRTRLINKLLHRVMPTRFDLCGPAMADVLAREILLQYDDARFSESKTGWRTLYLSNLCHEVTGDLMAPLFFGPVLAADPSFRQALERYVSDTIRRVGVLAVLPRALARLVCYCFNPNRARSALLTRITEIIRSGGRTWAEDDSIKRHTILFTLIEVSSKAEWDAETLAHALIGIWLAGGHLPWTQLHITLVELLKRPSWLTKLRQECTGVWETKADIERLLELPLLDAFIKETGRLHPVSETTIKRKALQDYTFASGGLRVVQGQLIEVDAAKMMSDPVIYEQPGSFDPTRWLHTKSHSTEVSTRFLFWGYGHKHCPGRDIAVLAMKIFISYLIHHFDLELEGDPESAVFHWERIRVASPSTKLRLRWRSQPA